MKYQSKLTMILKIEEKKRNKVQDDLRLLHTLKETILNEIKQEEEQVQQFFEELKKGGTVSSSFFSRKSDRAYQMKKEQELHDMNQLIAVKMQEYQTMKKKMERLHEIDLEREKEFLHEIEKKEAQTIEELKTMMRHFEKGGE